MQPHDVLGLFAMVMIAVAATLSLGGKETADEQAKTIRKGWAVFCVLLGALFIILANRNAAANFHTLSKTMVIIDAVTMAALGGFFIGMATHPIIQKLALAYTAFWIVCTGLAVIWI